MTSSSTPAQRSGSQRSRACWTAVRTAWSVTSPTSSRCGDSLTRRTPLGPFDAVIHNAGVIDGAGPPPVNVVAPYLLTASTPSDRLVYLSSSMHRGGRATSPARTGPVRDARPPTPTASCSSRCSWPRSPGAGRRQWRTPLTRDGCPTKMGGPSAPDDLALGHVTQVWLATSEAEGARASGSYWHHQRTEAPHPAMRDERLQEDLLAALAEHTGSELPRR